MSKNKTFLAVVMALSVALPAAAEIGVNTGVNTRIRASDDSEVRMDSKSEIDLGEKASDSLRVRSGATGTVNLRFREKGNESESATRTRETEDESATATEREKSEGAENQSARGAERSVSGKEFFKGEGFGGMVITPRAFTIDGNMVRTWTKDDEKQMKDHGASDDDIKIALEAKGDENVSNIEIEKDEKTGHGTVVIKYEAKVKIFGFIPVTAPVVATSSDSGAIVEVVAPWYIRWFTSTGDSEQAALSLASKIKARHDASLSATSTVK